MKALRVNTQSVRHTYTPIDHRLVAAAPENDLFKRAVYVPTGLSSTRPGADDHLAYKSFGNRT